MGDGTERQCNVSKCTLVCLVLTLQAGVEPVRPLHAILTERAAGSSGDDAKEIPLPNMRSNVLAKVVEFCNHHRVDPMKQIPKVGIVVFCKTLAHTPTTIEKLRYLFLQTEHTDGLFLYPAHLPKCLMLVHRGM